MYSLLRPPLGAHCFNSLYITDVFLNPSLSSPPLTSPPLPLPSSAKKGQEGLFSRLPGATHKRKLFADRAVEESVDSVGVSVTASQHSLAHGVSAGIQAIVGRTSRKSSTSVNEGLPTQHEHGTSIIWCSLLFWGDIETIREFSQLVRGSSREY